MLVDNLYAQATAHAHEEETRHHRATSLDLAMRLMNLAREVANRLVGQATAHVGAPLLGRATQREVTLGGACTSTSLRQVAELQVKDPFNQGAGRRSAVGAP